MTIKNRHVWESGYWPAADHFSYAFFVRWLSLIQLEMRARGPPKFEANYLWPKILLRGMCNFFLPPAIPLHFLFHFIFISSHPLSFTPLNYFHPSVLVLFHWYYPTNERKAAVLSRPNSGSCSPKQQWFMWPFFSFFPEYFGMQKPNLAAAAMPAAPCTCAAHNSKPQLKTTGSISVVPSCAWSSSCWYFICSKGPNHQLLTFTELVLFVASSTVMYRELGTLIIVALPSVYASATGKCVAVDLITLVLDLR